MDVPRAPSGGLYPPGGHILPGPSATELPAQDSIGWHPLERVQASLPRGHPAPSQRSDVPPHMRHQSAQAKGDSFR